MKIRLSNRFLGLVLAALCGGLSLPVAAQQAQERTALKVCADPYMLPFSNRDEQGFENKIAQLLADELGLPLKYEWFPQRMGFIRSTLRAPGSDGQYKCDVAMHVPEHFELAETTDPYYTSSYVLVYARGRRLDAVTEPAMLADAVEKNPEIKIGLSDRGPAQFWVFKSGLMGNMVPIQGHPGDPKVNPGEVLIRAIVDGDVDTAIVWGPTAGFYAKELRDQVELVLLPLKQGFDPKFPDMKFEYSFSMAVRFGEDAWRERLTRFIKDNQDEINGILREYGVPLLPLKKTPKPDDDD